MKNPGCELNNLAVGFYYARRLSSPTCDSFTVPYYALRVSSVSTCCGFKLFDGVENSNRSNTLVLSKVSASVSV